MAWLRLGRGGAGAWLVGAVALAAVATAVPGGSARASEPPAAGDLDGQVVVSDVLLAPGVSVPMLKRFQRSAVTQVFGFWRLHMVAFLDRPIEADSVMLAAYDVTAAGERRPVKVFSVPVEAGGRLVHVNDFVVAPSMGFEPGHRYEVVVEPDEGPGTGGGATRGKRDVYARGVVTLR